MSSQNGPPPGIGASTGKPASAPGLVTASIARGFRQLTDPTFRSVLVRSVLLSLVVFAVLTVFVWWALERWGVFDGIVGWAFDFVGWSLFLLVTWILFPAIVSLFISVFLDEIVDAVELRYYPDDPPSKALGVWEAFVIGLRFTALLVLLNLLVLPLQLLVFWLPLINFFIFYGLNGYLLTREYFDLVVLRHHDEGQVARLRRKNAGKIFPTGVVIAFLLTVPILNLVAPIVGVAAMVHVFKGLAKPE
ncbi:MAG: EI24 domain-containing protein [Proteobacteria bacterium]|nr:EI24 domain-containing protein [Pseudomonadota bacterium]